MPTFILSANGYVVVCRYDRDYIVEGKPYDGHDRHNGEIVAFHFNR